MQNKHKHILFISFHFAFIVFASSCHRKIANIPIAESQENTSDPVTMTPAGYTAATVVYLTLDGCAWMLRLEEGKYLQPYSLDPEFQKENLKVLIKYTLNKNAAGICMSGPIINITEIKLNQ